MRKPLALTALTFWFTTAVTSVALAHRSGGPRGGPASAPEIDGPGGVAAIALLVGVGLIAYNRYKNK
jgi:hypothetical protein